MRSGMERAIRTWFCMFVPLMTIGCAPSPKKTRPDASWIPTSVVVITLDTVRADHLHCYGDAGIQTPNIDALAASGVLFEKAVAQAPLTQPSHASMFTGTNPNVNHVRDNGFALQPSSATMATILRQHGWDTAAFISAAVLKKIFGFNQGFTTYDDRMPQATAGQGAATRPANATVDHAIRWLNSRPNKPFLMWVHLYDAHEPYRSPPQFRKEYPGDPYDAAIAFEDQQLGRFLDAIKKKSPSGKTLIVLLSDHGQGLGQHGEYEHGIFLYDSTVRIAWIMAGPGVPAGLRIRQQAREIDLLPTVLDLLGGSASSAVQGTSLVPAFSGKTVPTNYSYEETLAPKINMGWAELRGIHTAHWMYVLAPRPELYNLDRDPGELTNVIDDYPKKYRELASELRNLSGAESFGRETVTIKQMDQQTMNQLESLGYVSDFSTHKFIMDGKGDDPKDHLATLKVLYAVNGPDADKTPPARQAELLQQALRQDPADTTLYETLDDKYEAMGRYRQAKQVCLDALRHTTLNGSLLSNLANLYLREGNLTAAIAYYRQAAQKDPLDVEGQNDLATAYLQNNQLADAERVFRWVLAIQPYAPAYNGLGILADKRNDAASARKYFKQAIQLDPAYAEAQLNLGVVCTQMHDVPCARTALTAFLGNPAAADRSVVPQVKAELANMH